MKYTWDTMSTLILQKPIILLQSTALSTSLMAYVKQSPLGMLGEQFIKCIYLLLMCKYWVQKSFKKEKNSGEDFLKF